MIATITTNELTAHRVSKEGVLLIRAERKLTPQDFVKLASRLGKIIPFGLGKYSPNGFPPEVTLLDNQGDGITAAPRTFGEGWHQDSTFLPDPPAFTMLHALDIPSEDGDTHFADTRPALSKLSASQLETLSQLNLAHSVRGTYRISAQDVGRPLKEVYKDLPVAIHPALLESPGGHSLYLSPLYTKELLPRVSRAIFDRVLELVLESAVVHKWRVGDILIWDNRVVLHAATGYQGAEQRRLLRTVIHDGEAK